MCLSRNNARKSLQFQIFLFNFAAIIVLNIHNRKNGNRKRNNIINVERRQESIRNDVPQVLS